MDEIVWAVNPRHDSLDGLVTYICQFAQEYLTLAGIQLRLDVPAHLPPHQLRSDVRHNLFLAVKEALHNIVKHAHAQIVWLRLVGAPTASTSPSRTTARASRPAPRRRPDRPIAPRRAGVSATCASGSPSAAAARSPASPAAARASGWSAPLR